MALKLDCNSPSFFLTEHKYLQGRPTTTAANPRGKHHRRPLPWKITKLFDAIGWSEDADQYRRHVWEAERAGHPVPKRPIKPHYLNYIRAIERRNAVLRIRCTCCYDYSRERVAGERRREWSRLRNEGKFMAALSLTLPGDHHSPSSSQDGEKQPRRAPLVAAQQNEPDGGGSLFEDDGDDYENSEDVDDKDDDGIKELYNLGILYDDEHERGAGFSLNTIVRQEPVYRIAFRTPRKTRRRGGAAVAGSPETTGESVECGDTAIQPCGTWSDGKSLVWEQPEWVLPPWNLVEQNLDVWDEVYEDEDDDDCSWELASAASTMESWEALDFDSED
ncbi:hypothetical protein B0H63DRAFT_470848 [Podospora didyma]|uniref:Uncharacterized protein n=1 Tax=Podospora didyma TaxID=330526 RepID=A0AAE0NUG8_9PEZI|nr:hypothetical protein B0H63DRAFT_470848 [Podospora didyma]